MTDTSNTPNFTDIAGQIPGAARDFLRRSASDALGRAAGLQSGANRVVDAIQDTIAVSTSGSALLGRTLVQHAFQNVAATIGMVEKLAGAKCLGDAANIQFDFLRDYGRNSVEQVRETAGIVQKSLKDSGDAVRGVFVAPKTVAAADEAPKAA